MNLRFNIWLFFFLFFLIVVQLNIANAQTKKPGVTEDNYRTIQHALEQNTGDTYKVIGIINIDSVQVAEHWIFEKHVEDTYGTLINSYLFFATTRFVEKTENEEPAEPKERIGIYKDGRIIWFSDPLVTPISFAGGGFYGVLDLNKDNKIDIIVSLFAGSRGQTEVLWIFSWDGNRAELISNVDEEGRSTIMMQRDLSELIDVEPDGILEIKGEDFKESPVIFSWNGQEYGDWGISIPNILPRNKVQVEIISTITKTKDEERLIFNYKIINKQESLQSIEEFEVENYFVVSENNSMRDNWEFRKLSTIHLVGWQIGLFLEQHPEALLKPGESDSSFSLSTTGMPRPATFYVKGNNGDLSFDTDDLINNSVNGTTLGPYNPPETTSVLTDSLRSFTTQACEINWITNKGICNSLESKLENMKKQLERDNKNSARNMLQAFINEVEAQKDKHLSSEGYGLLYFNAVYLKEKLVDQ